MQTPGHLRHSRLLGTLVTVSVTNAAAAAASGLRSEETQGRVVPLITANHLLCEVLSLAGGGEEVVGWGLHWGGRSDEEEGRDKKSSVGLPGQARVRPVAESQSHQVGKWGWRPSSVKGQPQCPQGRNRENWGRENGHPSMAQLPKSLNLDAGLPLTRFIGLWGQCGLSCDCKPGQQPYFLSLYVSQEGRLRTGPKPVSV